MAWQLDTAHSAIEFTARHMMISKVRGRFDKFAGSVNINEQNPELTTVEVTIDAATITTQIKARFFENKEVAGSSISVETLNGTVMLSGFAKNASEKATAASIAGKVNGVKAVRNEIVIRP